MSNAQVLNRAKIHNVLVSGGTHGNEYTGAFLARHWETHPQAVERPGFSTHVLFANPQAFRICRRYVERDLNRSFHPSGQLENPHALELTRAREIESWLRDKCSGNLPDVVFDLHSTTANMGLSLVLTNRAPFNLYLLSYLRTRFSDVNAYLWEEPGSQPGFLNSLSEKGFALEVGPVANGVLDATWVLKTEALTKACLDFVEMWNRADSINVPDTVPLFCFRRHVDYPRAADGLPAAMIHPDFQNTDFKPLHPGQPVFLAFNGDVLCWEGEVVWPVFINEAAYYEKGIAFTVCERIEINLAQLG